MADYFIKRLGNQEMGSPTIENGKIKFHRGRYMLISKDCCHFFPHLSTTVLNDSTALPILTGTEDEIAYAQYVYHNSKQIDTVYKKDRGRDEIRIYLNAKVGNGDARFMPNDIVVFRQCQDQDTQFFVLHHYTLGSQYFQFWNDKLEGKNFTLWSSSDAPDFAENYTLPGRSANIIGDERIEQAVETQQQQVLEHIDSLEQSMGAGLFNSRTFHDFVMMAYQEKCAVTRRVISCNGFSNLEAAHIMPQAHNGSFLPCNGIAMSRDMHCVFDKGFFMIEDDYTIIVHPDVLRTDSYLNEYNGQKIFVPQIEYFRPHPRFLQHHRNNVFGSFRQIRSNWIPQIQESQSTGMVAESTTEYNV